MSAPEPSTFLGDLPPLSTRNAARARTVPIAAALLVVQAIVGLVGIAVSFAYRDVLREGTSNADAIVKHLAGQPTDVSLFGVGGSVVLSVIFLVLATFVLRGSNPARIATWVFSALGVLFGVGLQFSSQLPPAKDGADWYEANSAVWGVGLAALVIHAAIVVLLALRRSNEYFAKRAA